MSDSLDFKTLSVKMRSRIKELLKTNNMKQSDLAKLTGFEPSSVSQMLSGSRSITIETVLRLSQIFNVSIDYLVGKTKIQSPDPKVTMICKYTGLSEDAIVNLHDIKANSDQYEKEDSDPLFSHISALLSLNSSDGFLKNMIIIETYLNIFCKSSKEMRELDMNLPKIEEEHSNIMHEFEEFNKKTDDLLSAYLDTMVEINAAKLKYPIKDDNGQNLTIKDLNKRLSDTADKIEKINPSIDYNNICIKFIDEINKYDHYRRNLKRAKSEKAEALMALYEVLDYLSTK